MTIFFNLLLHFGLILIIFFSICGLGKLVATKMLDKLNNNNLFLVFFLGIIVLYVLQFFLYFFLSINYTSNIIILILGLFLFFRKNYFQNRDIKLFIFLVISLFLIFIISKTHEDFKHHHLQSVLDLFDNNLTLGKANINPAFIYVSSLSYVIAFTKYPFFENQFFHIIPYLIYICFLGYIISPIINNFYNKREKYNFILPILIFFFLLQFKYLKKFGFDVPALIFSLIFFLESIKNNNFFKNIIYFIYAFSIKITSIFIIPIVLFYLTKFIILKKQFDRYALIFSTFLILIISISNFINNGCLLYIIKETCFNKENISWVINKEKISQISNQTELDTKAYFQQDEFDQIEYLKKFNWFKNWFNNGFIYKILNFILLFIISYLITLFFLKIKFSINKKNIYLWLCSLICVGMWFLKIPTLRYGITPLLIFFITTLLLFHDSKINFFQFNKNIVIIIFSIIIINNSFNLKRIISEFDRTDSNYYKDFPFYYLPQRKFKTIIIDKLTINIPIDNLIYPCWNIPNQCIENEELIIDNNKIYIKSSNFYNTIYTKN